MVIPHARRFLQNSLRTGALAGVATILAIMACGRRERCGALAPINAVSHIAWGNKAARQRGPSWKYTLTGLALNTTAVTSWAAFYELLFGRATDKSTLTKAVIGGPLVSGIAYVTDYHLVPERLTPGFETRLSNRSLLGIYTVLAAALTVGGLARK